MSPVLELATMRRRQDARGRPHARPRWATPRNPDRDTRGPEVRRVAAMLGWHEQLPWQVDLIDTLWEVDDNGSLHYDVATALVPRRAGKTVVGFSSLVHRAQAWDTPQRSISTMQQGTASREMFRNVWVPKLNSSPFAKLYHPMYQISHEELIWHNGSLHVVAAPTGKAGVGGDYDLWLCDEAWAHLNNKVEGAITPTMATRAEPQVLYLSMAGDDTSVLLKRQRDAGRQLVEHGADSRIFYLEYSAPEDSDPLDPATWWGCHPALGYTISEQRLKTYSETMDVADFAKEFLGIWPGKAKTRAIPADVWDALADGRQQLGGELALGIDVSPDRQHAAVGVAGPRRDGSIGIEVLRHDRGTSWVVPFVVKVCRAAGQPLEVGLDHGSSAGALVPELLTAAEAGLLRHRKLMLRDVVGAAGMLFDLAMSGGLRYWPNVALSLAVEGARKRLVGSDGAWAWGRVEDTDITPLVACSAALWVKATEEAAPKWSWRIA